jgi:cyclopropane fatty-acyl-phospholipid synthase-like methyltransferase
MPYSQITENWNKRFLEDNTPWEDETYSTEMERLFTHFINPGSSVLEVGCSKGVNGVYLASMGYEYKGIDISSEAIRDARFLAKSKNSLAKFKESDFMSDSYEEKYDAIFDKGLFHTFTEEKYRKEFIDKVLEYLKPNGFWVSISGNKDHPDSKGDAIKYGYPRIAALDIISIAEYKFQLHYLARCIYGAKEGSANFLGWAAVMQKR